MDLATVTATLPHLATKADMPALLWKLGIGGVALAGVVVAILKLSQ